MPGYLKGPASGLWQAAGLGIMLGAITVVGALVGQYLDRRWGTGPWLTLAGTVLGMLAGLFEVIGALRKLESAETKRRE